jgi:hypothetical protein
MKWNCSLFNEQGADFGEEIERRASDAKLIFETAERYGIAVEMLWKPGGLCRTFHNNQRKRRRVMRCFMWTMVTT